MIQTEKIIKEEDSVANTQIVDVSFKELLNYQRVINATALNEEVINDDGIDKILYYKNQKANDIDSGYENENLTKLKTINDVEMEINYDSYVLIPLERIKNKDIKISNAISKIESYKYEYLSNLLDEYYKSTFESKIDRIKHSFVGKIKFRIPYDADYIAKFITASAIIGQDSISKCGVLILTINNSYVPASYLIENMLQSNIEIIDGEKLLSLVKKIDISLCEREVLLEDWELSKNDILKLYPKDIKDYVNSRSP